MYKRLILNGGALKGLVLVGAIKGLEEEGLMESIDTYTGVSVGGLISLVLNLGYKADEIFSFFNEIKEDIQDISVLTFPEKYGFYNCKNIMKMVTNSMTEKGISVDITFQQLYELTKKELILVVTNLSKDRTEYLSYKTTPNMKVVNSMRMTINIPIYFEAIKYKGDFYVDGATTNNFPIHPKYPDGKDMFENELDKNLVLMLTKKDNEFTSINNIEDYFMKVFKTLINIQMNVRYDSYKSTKQICENHSINKYNEKIIDIEVSDIDMLNFSMKEEEKKKLFDIGYNRITSLHLNS